MAQHGRLTNEASGRKPRGRLSPRQLAVTRKRAEAAELRLRGYTFQQIAETLGLSARRAHQLVDEAPIATITAVPSDRLRVLEIARLERLLSVFFPRALAGDHSAVGSVLKIMARTGKLMGLDAMLGSTDGRLANRLHHDRCAPAAITVR